MTELLPYTRFLFLLQHFFGNRKFTTSEVSKNFVRYFDNVPTFPKQRLSRFKPKLISNGLRRLWIYELLAREEVPFEVTKPSGKMFHRGRQFVYWISLKGFRYLTKTPLAKSLVPGFDSEFAENMADIWKMAYLKETLSGSEELVGLGTALPSTRKILDDLGILRAFSPTRRKRLPNRVSTNIRKKQRRIVDLFLVQIQQNKEDVLKLLSLARAKGSDTSGAQLESHLAKLEGIAEDLDKLKEAMQATEVTTSRLLASYHQEQARTSASSLSQGIPSSSDGAKKQEDPLQWTLNRINYLENYVSKLEGTLEARILEEEIEKKIDDLPRVIKEAQEEAKREYRSEHPWYEMPEVQELLAELQSPEGKEFLRKLGYEMGLRLREFLLGLSDQPQANSGAPPS